MKHLKRFLSAILTAAMLLTMVPFAASAAATDITYDVSLLDANFNNISDNSGITAAGLSFKETTYVTVEAAADPAADGAHGTAVKLAKTESPEDAAVGSADSYFRVNYESEDNITTRFANSPEVLANVKASMDIYLPEDFDGFNIRFFDKTSGTTKADNFAVVSRITDENGNVKANVGFMNGGNEVLDVNTWYTFEFYVDVPNGVYSAAINGVEKATDCAITDSDNNGKTIDTCVSAFGIQQGAKTAAYTIYLDNFKFEIPKDGIIPQNTNTVWENDFDDAEVTSGSLAGASENVAAIDYKPENADWEIIEEADGNKYYYFQPNSTSKVANSGNCEDGYFKTSNTDVREEDENGKTITGLTAASSWDKTPYGIDNFKIDRLRLDFSIKVNKLMEMQLGTYYRGTMYGQYNSVNKLLWLRNDGTIDYGLKGNNQVAEYEPGEWIDVSMYINFADHYMACYINEEFVGIETIWDTIPHFNQIRFRIDKATTETYSDYGVSLDNIRYSTTYSENYINRNPYTVQLAKVDYKDVEAGTVLNSTTDPSKYQFSTDAVSGTVVYDEEKGHNVMFYNNSAGQGTGTGLPAAAAQASAVYTKNDKYPDVVRVEAEVKRAVATAIYVHIQGKEIMMHGGSSNLQFKNGDSRVKTDVDPGQNNWYKVAFDLDFANGTYDAYYNGTLMAENHTIPTGITAPENIVVSSNTVQNNAYVNYISVAALAPYGADGLCEYFDINGDWQIGYAMNNDDDAAAAHKLIVAKFDSDDNLEEITAIENESVAAGAYSVCGTSLLEAEDDGYYKYFVWEDFDTIKPLLSNEIVK